MSDKDIRQQEGTNPDNEPEVEEELDTPDDGEALKELLAKEREAKASILARAKKAEAKLKELSSQPNPQVEEQKPNQASLSVEETVLLANGMPEELIKELKVIAQVRGTSIIKAQNDPVFVAIKDNFEKAKKTEDATISASRGSSQVKPKKDLKTVGLSREEHMKLVKERSGQ